MTAQTLHQPLTCLTTGQSIHLTEPLATSGEGTVWRTHSDRLLAKLYNHPTAQRIQKLDVMVANPPQDPNEALGHISFAWPQSLLVNHQGQCLGFLMPRIANR
ncbi:MAG: hypothetical protein F6K09_31260, partial [Merismopedia sp. SIO2A8]|nr:hypothetical protein [Merismopedia sp. SIO2A8]